MAQSFTPPKMRIHMHFAPHVRAKDFESALNSFEKHGPFDVFSYENALSPKKKWLRSTVAMNRIAMFSREDKEFQNSDGFAKNLVSYDDALFDFLLEKNIIFATIEAYKPIALVRNMKLARFFNPRSKEDIFGFSMSGMFLRETDMFNAILGFYDGLKPVLKKLKSELLGKTPLNVFAVFGLHHFMLAPLVKNESDGKIEVSYSLSDADYMPILENYSQIRFMQYSDLYLTIEKEIYTLAAKKL